MPASRPIILVVDDNTSVLKLLSRALEAANFSVLTADDRMSAEATLLSLPVDAMIVDLRLGPDASGLDVIEFARAREPLRTLPVLVLTGVTQMTPEEEDAIRHHGAYVFYKPIVIGEISATLNRLLRPPASAE